MLVPGAMATRSAARAIMKPADAARAPEGATQTAVGTGLDRKPCMMSRIETSRPPGVESRSRKRAAFSSSARRRASRTNSAVTGEMASSTVAWRTVRT